MVLRRRVGERMALDALLISSWFGLVLTTRSSVEEDLVVPGFCFSFQMFSPYFKRTLLQVLLGQLLLVPSAQSVQTCSKSAQMLIQALSEQFIEDKMVF